MLWRKSKAEEGSKTIIWEDLNSLLSINDNLNRQKVSNNIKDE